MRKSTYTFLYETLALCALPGFIFAAYVVFVKGSDAAFEFFAFCFATLIINVIVGVQIAKKIDEECRFVWRYKDDPDMKPIIEENIKVYNGEEGKAE